MGASCARRRFAAVFLGMPWTLALAAAQAPVVPLSPPAAVPVAPAVPPPVAGVPPAAPAIRPPTSPVRVQEPKDGTKGKDAGVQPAPKADTPIQPVPKVDPSIQPTPGGSGMTPSAGPAAPSGPVPTPGGGLAAAGGAAGTPSNTTNVNPESAAPTPAINQSAPAGATASTVTGGGGAAGAATNATTASDLIGRSTASTGVELQQRNSVSADLRIRGLRPGQYTTTAMGGLFLPARLDLDTAVGKFDPGSIQSITAVKGPYSALYGPGLSFLDIVTLGSPRTDSFQWHGRSSGGYQTNGRQWNGLQTVEVSDQGWGFRGTYNILQGNDYRSGNGTQVPASYLSNNINFALGVDLSPHSSLEFKGLRVIQNNLEFPGLYFDISQADTEAYSARYTLTDQGFFDKLTFDVWYNSTAASGDTQQGAKQAFVQKLLGVSFNPQFGYGTGQFNPAWAVGGLAGRAPTAQELAQAGPVLPSAAGLNLFTDSSTTRFAGRSIGYRLATSWAGPDGNKADPWLTVGTDLNAFGQGLSETIRINQIAGTGLNSGLPILPGSPVQLIQNQGIPESNQINPGLFLQSAIPFTNRWTVRSGGRVDLVHSSSNPRQITGNFDLFGPFASPGYPPAAFGTPPIASRTVVNPITYSTDPANDQLTRNYTLMAGFVQNEYKLDDNWTALAAFGHSERAPTLTELYATGPFIGVLQQGTSRLIGDPNLKQERLTQIDLGLRADYQFFQAGGNLFYAWVQNYITYDANRLSPGLTQVVYTNTNQATLAGAELFAQMDVTSWLTPFGTLSYVQGTDQSATDGRRPADLSSSRRDDPARGLRASNSEPLPQIPPLESRVGLRFHQATARPAWQVEFSARMVAGQNRVADNLGELPTGGFTVFNIRGFWKVTDYLLVSAGVDNLGDRNYREHLDPISGNLLGVGPLLRPGTNFFFNTQLSY